MSARVQLVRTPLARLQTNVCLAAFALALLLPPRVQADEIRLKDGRKLFGVIVAYEDGMFKVKTDFGYELIEKDKIASIIPSAPAGSDAKKDSLATKDSNAKPATPSSSVETAIASEAELASEVKEASAKSAAPARAGIANPNVRPSLPLSKTHSASGIAPALNAATPAASSMLAAPAVVPAPPANTEAIQGNLYTNLTYGFHMYKAPSWNLLEDARSALPNAIVALGTTDESTLMVVGREKSKENLDATAKAVEARLREVYEDYRQLSQRKTTVSGLPAEEFHYRGKADGRDWSGTLVVLAHGNDIFTVLGMTYADTDLIQIQENVIARAIASLAFSAK